MTYRHWKRTSGPSIAGDVYGHPTSPAVVLLHGGGQTRHSWKGAGHALAAAGFYALTIDMRGHGDSGWADDGDYELDALVDDLTFVVTAERLDRPALVGASMGGATALVAQGERRVSAGAVVLVDVAPRTEAEGVERVRDFMLQAPDGFASLDEVADAVATYQPHRGRPASTDGLRKNVRVGEDGRYRWHWDPMLVAHDVDMSAREQRMAAAALALDVPTLLVRGHSSDVLSEAGVQDFRSLVPHAEYVDVAGAGHMVAGDVNDAFIGSVLGFLDRCHRH